ncbi:MAG: hypothetical protein IJD04_02795 [Desulfovibrionaceae bacterium]|nr:hypothetical protein [Desulfovibrionaceae bacterium]
MSGSKFLGWLAILIFSCTAAWAGPAFTDIQDEQGIARISLGEIELIALEDSPAVMGIGLFSGPLTPEEIESLLPEGYAPASVNVFVVIAAEQTILIDSGNGQNGNPAGKLLKQLSHAGIAAG